ncbi:MAG: DUF4253 domain-containing protein [Clostridia bacterium]|nr:DUF4253 domain-containing protein [Clostridia bacterium]
MGILRRIFPGKEQPPSEPSAVSRAIAAYLDCPYEYIPQGTAYGETVRRFNNAVAEGNEQGYVPVLIATNEVNLAEMLYDNAGLSDFLNRSSGYQDRQFALKEGFALTDGEKSRLHAYRDSMIAGLRDTDAEDFLRTRMAESAEDEEFDLEEEWGGEEIYFEFSRDSFSAPFDDDTQKSHELLLAKIPAAEPWQVAAWLPMGGWNECPAPEELLAMAKRWYDKYRAVICCVTSDELEFRVSDLPTDMEEAYALAKEQYYFCQDRVEQYADEYNLRTLADNLTKSPFWYFWWD